MARRFDYVLVGVGLQNALVTLALAARRPGSRVLLVERAEAPLGNHTWCFHAGDVPEAARDFVEPALASSWPRYRVRFPGYTRTLEESYVSVTVPSLKAALERACERLHASMLLGRSAVEVGAHHVLLDDGTRIEATVVIDARGPTATVPRTLGFQKFVGLELRLSEPRSFDPVIMDATVEQIDGFRFMYVLPFAPDRVLVEDTYYSRSPELDVAKVTARVLAHAAQLGLGISTIERREQGVLPLPGKVALPNVQASGPLCAGYAGGLFHPVTGYSFPLAVRFAQRLATLAPEEARGGAHAAFMSQVRGQARYLAWLNGLLFHGMADDERRNVLERFYTLPEPTIRRFYAMTLTPVDKARIVCGRPPRGFSLSSILAKHQTRPA
nr:lycopene cyclase [uncultured bacterium]